MNSELQNAILEILLRNGGKDSIYVQAAGKD
jgi:hypothetical protein